MTVTPTLATRVLRAIRWRGAVALALLALMALSGGALPAAPAAGQAPNLTVEQLRQGGYVIFFRHTTADDGVDLVPVNLDDCATQRNLREQGLREARTIGNGIRAQAIPVGTVYASEICRAKETAGIAFGRYEMVPALNLCCIDGKSLTAEGRIAVIEQMLALEPPSGVNTVIVAHGVGPVSDLQMGEAAIYKPDGLGGTVRVARVLPGEWERGVFPPGGTRLGQ